MASVLNRVRAIGLIAAAFAALGTTAACEDPFSPCFKNLNCPGDGDSPGFSGGTSPGGDGSGGATSPSGGSKAGGAANSGGGARSGGSHAGGAATSGGMGGEAAGGAPPKPCDGKCKGDTPFCDEAKDKCVGCLKHTDCDEPTKPMCLEGSCVACKDDFSCKDTLGLEDTPICLDGTEDMMTTGEVRPDTGACAECGRSSDCGGDVCDLETLTCLTGLKYRKSAECDPCVNDLECIEGQMCVEQVFVEPITSREVTIGKFCTWTKEAIVGSENDCSKVAIGQNENPPFSQELHAKNAAGEDMVFCALGTTTCLGYTDHKQEISGCDQLTAGSDQAAADAACGALDVNDAVCRPVSEGSSFYKCTYLCGGTEDCKPTSSCPLSGAAKGYCSL